MWPFKKKRRIVSSDKLGPDQPSVYFNLIVERHTSDKNSNRRGFTTVLFRTPDNNTSYSSTHICVEIRTEDVQRLPVGQVVRFKLED